MYCPNCGKKILDDAKYCQYCGLKVEGAVISSSTQTSLDELMNAEFPVMPDYQDSQNKNSRDIGENIALAHGVNLASQKSVAAAREKFYKDQQYNRANYEDLKRMKDYKMNAFSKGGEVIDPYTNHKLELTKKQAKALHGDQYNEFLANTDHTQALENFHEKHSKNPFLTQADAKKIANDDENYKLISQKTNYIKKDGTNAEVINDEKKRSALDFTPENEEKFIKDGELAEKINNRKVAFTTAKNAAATFNKAGMAGAASAAEYVAVYDVISNSIAVFNGEKDAIEALKDTAKDTAKAAAKAYVMNGGLTTALQAISTVDSPFITSMLDNNVPAKVVMAVTVYGKSVYDFCSGNITAGEFAQQSLEASISFAAMKAGGAAGAAIGKAIASGVGQTLIPIPVVGEVVGSMVATAISQVVINKIRSEINDYRDHKERERIISQCNKLVKEKEKYKKKLDACIDAYFADLRGYLNDAMFDIKEGFESGDADTVILGANKITEKMGGSVKYRNMNEFKLYLQDEDTDVL